MQNYVFVIDQSKQPLNPVPPARARELLKKGKAAVFRLYPFTLILKHSVDNPILKPLILKLDPGSKVTGIALLDGDKAIWVAELEHRGQQIKNALESRKSIRRVRRSRKTRYLAALLACFSKSRRKAQRLLASTIAIVQKDGYRLLLCIVF